MLGAVPRFAASGRGAVDHHVAVLRLGEYAAGRGALVLACQQSYAVSWCSLTYRPQPETRLRSGHPVGARWTPRPCPSRRPLLPPWFRRG
jgi:hypothetical protein